MGDFRDAYREEIKTENIRFYLIGNEYIRHDESDAYMPDDGHNLERRLGEQDNCFREVELETWDAAVRECEAMSTVGVHMNKDASSPPCSEDDEEAFLRLKGDGWRGLIT